MQVTEFIHELHDYTTNNEIKDALLNTLKSLEITPKLSKEAQGVLLMAIGVSLLDWTDN